MKKYAIQIIRWEPKTISFEIEAENALDARTIAVQKTHEGTFDDVPINPRNIRTTVLRCYKWRRTNAAE